MSTRGLYGFRKDGKDKLTCNSTDSYPEYLGNEIVTFCKETTAEEMREIYDRIELVDPESEPTKEQLHDCVESDQGDDQWTQWYDILRRNQGSLKELNRLNRNKKRIFMTDDGSFIKESIGCEYAYIINLDDESLEFYYGMQVKPDVKNRYGKQEYYGFYPCKMLRQFSLSDIKATSVIKTVNQMIMAKAKDETKNERLIQKKFSQSFKIAK